MKAGVLGAVRPAGADTELAEARKAGQARSASHGDLNRRDENRLENGLVCSEDYRFCPMMVKARLE